MHELLAVEGGMAEKRPHRFAIKQSLRFCEMLLL